MVDPNGDWLDVTRLDHNLGKIHDIALARFQLDGVTRARATRRNRTRRSRRKSWKFLAASSVKRAWART